MTLLSDRDIAREVASGNLKIEPWAPKEQLQPASYDCKLGDELLIPSIDGWVDPQRSQNEAQLWNILSMSRHFVRLPDGRALIPTMVIVEGQSVPPNYSGPGLWLAPGQFVLGHTEERFALPDYLSARIEGKSSLGRWGLVVHVTAGFVDPGFSGQLTLELRNVGPFHLLLRAGMAISQVSFSLMSSRVERPYGSPGLGSQYQGQERVQPARGIVERIKKYDVGGGVYIDGLDHGDASVPPPTPTSYRVMRGGE